MLKKVDKLNMFYKKLREDNITPKLAAYDKLCPQKPIQRMSGKGIRNMYQIWDHHLDDAAVDAYF